MSDIQEAISLRTVLSRVSAELAVGVDVSVDLQDGVSDLIGAGMAVNSQSAYHLQALDRLTQTLQCLHRFMASVSQEVTDEATVDARHAVSRVFLRDLADRLVPMTHGDEDNSRPNGDLDLF